MKAIATKNKSQKVNNKLYFKTKLGKIYLGDALDVLQRRVKPGAVDLIVTSPPFGLVRKKESLCSSSLSVAAFGACCIREIVQ